MNTNRTNKKQKPYRYSSSYFRKVNYYKNKDLGSRNPSNFTLHVATSSQIVARSGSVRNENPSPSTNELSFLNGAASCSSIALPTDAGKAIYEDVDFDDEIHDNIYHEEDVYSKSEEEDISNKINFQQKLRHWALVNKCTLRKKFVRY